MSWSNDTSEEHIQGIDLMRRRLGFLHRTIGETLQRGRVLIKLESRSSEYSSR